MFLPTPIFLHFAPFLTVHTARNVRLLLCFCSLSFLPTSLIFEKLKDGRPRARTGLTLLACFRSARINLFSFLLVSIEQWERFLFLISLFSPFGTFISVVVYKRGNWIHETATPPFTGGNIHLCRTRFSDVCFDISRFCSQDREKTSADRRKRK